MKTLKNLYPEITEYKNLYLAFKNAAKGKRWKPYVEQFKINLERELFQLQDELRSKTYQPGHYYNFYITEPKRRLVSAAPFRDRVVHHAICNIIEPVYDKIFIYDSYACRKEKGQHKAADRFTKFCRANKYVYKCDIQKYFPSIDHEILFSILKRKIKDHELLWLLKCIIQSGKDILKDEYIVHWYPGDDLLSPVERNRGLPIGNLTSQFLANVYLNELDYFVKFMLRCHYYIRYMDDFVIFSNSKTELRKIREEIINYLATLRLSVHPKKDNIFPVTQGTDFMGYRIFQTHRRLRKSNIKIFIKRMKIFQEKYKAGTINFQSINQSVQSWIGHACHADTWYLRK
ncbi:MAG: RNA-dependent DNA polymerase, partial [Candidatus Lokiarchaeota archaeon]|nr:RNA-dependent DNA polymerase [Candidatus Lokiarchaeota archaeon]